QISSREETEKALKNQIHSWYFDKEIDDSIQFEVNRILSFRYPYQRATETRAKESVTEIKRRQEILDENSTQSFIPRLSSLSQKRPKFLQEENQLSRGEIGTAMHAVMQYLPLEKPLSRQEIRAYI